MNKKLKNKVIKNLRAGKKELETHKLGKNAYAKLANGQTECGILDPKAACLCMEGALRRACGNPSFFSSKGTEPFQLADKLLNTAVRKAMNLGYSLNDDYDYVYYEVNNYNDNPKTTKKDALARFDDAISLAKKL